MLKYVLPSLPGVGSDIKKPGVTELSYDRVPVRAAATLPQIWRQTTRDLPASPSRCWSTGAARTTWSGRQHAALEAGLTPAC